MCRVKVGSVLEGGHGPQWAKPLRRPEGVRTRTIDFDRGLVESLRFGEASAAEHLISLYGHRAYRLAIRICRNEQDAEEVVQDAVWAVISSVDSFRGEATFSSWLYRIVANTAYQKLRSRRRKRTDLSLEELLPFSDKQGEHVAPMEDWSGRLPDQAARTELRMTLTPALDELSPENRTILLLHAVEGLSIREIAHTLGISVANVKIRAYRARLLLRERLADRVSWKPRRGGRKSSAVNTVRAA